VRFACFLWDFRYFIAVHDRRTQKTIFRPSPLHILVREVKAFKGADPSPVTLKERVTARAALGESFGTKKAQAALKAAERNKVDVSAMDGVMEHLVNRIESNTKTLPTEGARLHSIFRAARHSQEIIPRTNGI
jgi:DNA-directed RNA polymerase I subunit RPA49